MSESAKNTEASAAVMDFTGERFVPECVREIWYEHWHRYVFAREFARDKRVLDAACGEGYGSNLLAAQAHSVLGVDIADAAIAHARQRYARQLNLRFEQGDCTALAPGNVQFDLVVSFETLEHVAAQEALIAGFARVLTDEGVLIVSSPDKRTYSDVSGFRNEFHVRELYRDELLTLLKSQFPFVHLYGQKLLFQSVVWALDGDEGSMRAATASGPDKSVSSGMDYDPMYFIAVCSRQPLRDRLPGLALFGDREESVYRHYNDEVRKNMAAGARIAELEAELEIAQRARGKVTPTGNERADMPRKRGWRRWWPR